MPVFTQTHSIVIEAPATAIHPLLADFHEWTRWSPWEGIDPALRRTYDGEGVGATYHWKGNKQAGEGTMTFTSITAEQIDVDLSFRKPVKAENEVAFRLTPVAEGTRVEWTMSGNRNAAFAVMGRLFFDRAIGKQIDQGLARLKAAAEAA